MTLVESSPRIQEEHGPQRDCRIPSQIQAFGPSGHRSGGRAGEESDDGSAGTGTATPITKRYNDSYVQGGMDGIPRRGYL